ncbi:glutamine amidotransferase-like class 1 domain-containing protein 1 isoform X4 [Paroedura picta]|uniref:glutamine amidotransferase-like class 1 domain-containing protein 1 isoform X4 n=1 Tax=Paroedura picta TaxID=143630 RepID=UPI0040572FF2
MSERLSKPTCLIVSSAAAAGVSADSFLHSFTLASAAFNLQVATPGGKPIDFVGVNEANMRWIQDFRMKSYANPAKLESTDGARYHALLIPDCPGAMTDLANSGYLARILQHFSSENKPICAVGHGVAALCCATNEDKSWVFEGYSLTGKMMGHCFLMTVMDKEDFLAWQMDQLLMEMASIICRPLYITHRQ